LQQRPDSEPFRVVHSQQGNGGAAYWRFPNEVSAVATKVLLPSIAARVEKPHDLAPAWFERGEVGAFCKIAIGTRQSEVLGRFPAAVLSRRDVLDMKVQFRELLWKVAILTAVASPLANQLAQKGVQQAAFGRRKNARASALRRVKKELARTSDSNSARCLGVSVPSEFLEANAS
jgi:hypothetical protein